MDKRTIHSFLLMTILLMASKASALADTYQKGDFTYTFDSGGQEASISLNSDKAAVTVPATIDIDGKTYKVTAIDDYGFTYGDDVKHYTPGPYIYEGVKYNVNPIRDGYNNYRLHHIYFELPSNIRRIGTSAFQGCTNLESIAIPNSVEEMGTEVFTECYELKKVEFQTDEKHRVKLKVLPANTFYLCPRLQSLELPEGIEEIGNYALQCNLSLKSIHLPNTLKKIGGHFLCNAKSLESLTIPASVTEIAGAFLHGCESLRTVYLLGGAASLNAVFNDDKYGTSTSFDEFEAASTAPASDKVNNCKFYVPSDYYDDYVDNEVWKQLHNSHNALGNDIITLSGHDRSFGAMKWQTVIFYKPVASYKSVFGEECMVAELTAATQDGSDPDFYHLTFTLIEDDDIPAQRPYLIYCPKKQTHVMYDKEDEESDDFKSFYTQSYTQDVTVSNEPSTTISMIGMGNKLALQQWDFYFKWNEESKTGKFYRVPDAKTNISKAFFGCYWRIIRNGLKQTGAMANSKSLPSTPTSIKQVEGKQPQADLKVYDLQGRLIQQGTAGLGKGIYIVNGKKVTLP